LISINGNELKLESNDENNNKTIGKILYLSEKFSKESNIAKNDNDNNENKNNSAMILNETEKYHIEFLFNLHFFKEDFQNNINGTINNDPSIKEGYIINTKFVESIKKNYYYHYIKKFFQREKEINEIFEFLGKDYIEKIEKHRGELKFDENLFNPNDKHYKNMGIKYFVDSTILNSFLIQILYKDKKIYNKFERMKIVYSIIKKKVVIIYNLNINIGILDLNNNIFKPEILILFKDENNIKYIFNELKSSSIENFLNQINIKENNVGNYKEDNVVVFLNEKYIPRKSQIKKMDNLINPKIDYSSYIINNEFKSILKLYFYYQSFKLGTHEDKKYYLINEEYINKYKEHYDYSNLEVMLINNKFCSEVSDKIKTQKNHDLNKILSDEMVTLIIKNLPADIIEKFNVKRKTEIKFNYVTLEPKIKNVQNSEILYYDEFELIDEEIYKSLFEENSKGTFGECIFKKEYIFIKLPAELNKKINSIFIILGALNQNNIFKAKYLLEFPTNDNFKKLIKYANSNEGLASYLNSIQFNNNIAQLYGMNNKPLGLIYNLHFVPPPIPFSTEVLFENSII